MIGSRVRAGSLEARAAAWVSRLGLTADGWRRRSAEAVRAALLYGQGSSAGARVTEDTALTVAAVTTCVSLLSRTLASLPVHTYRRRDDGGRALLGAKDHFLPGLLSRPNPWQTRFELFQSLHLFFLLYRNAFAWVNWIEGPRGTRVPAEIIPIHPGRVTVRQAHALAAPTYAVTIRGGEAEKPIPANEILHIRGLSTNGVTGRPTLADGREMIGLAQVQQEHAGSFWSRGGRPDVLLKHPKVLGDIARKNLEETWEESYGGGADQRRVAVLEEGLDAVFPTASHEAAQFVETSKMTRGEVAGWFHVPPHLIGDTEKSSSWGTGIEQQVIGFLVFAISPDLVAFEQRINRDLLLDDPDRFVAFKIEGLLRGDSAARGAFYKILREIGVASANEIRALENMNPRAGGDRYDDLAYAQRPAGAPKEGV